MLSLLRGASTATGQGRVAAIILPVEGQRGLIAGNRRLGFRDGESLLDCLLGQLIDPRRRGIRIGLRRGKRGPQKAPTKKLVSLRLPSDVIEHYKAGGPGWQTRIERTLLESIKRGA